MGAGAAAVVLVGDIPDDLLDGILEGDDAGGAAVLGMVSGTRGAGVMREVEATGTTARRS